MERSLLTETSRRYLGKNNILRAATRIASDLDHLFFEKLFLEYRFDAKTVDSWKLTRKMEELQKINVVSAENVLILRRFVQFRNKLVHDRTLHENIRQNKERLAKAKDLCRSVCDYVDNFKVKSSRDKEIEYNKFSDEKRTKEKTSIDF